MSRKSLLAEIHIAKKELGLDDETYRDTLEGITGKRSASELSDKQLATVLNVFKKHGFKPKKRSSFQKTDDPQHKKALVLWSLLNEAGVVRNGSPQALAQFATSRIKTDRVEWLTPSDWNRIIEVLKQWCYRCGVEVDD